MPNDRELSMQDHERLIRLEERLVSLTADIKRIAKKLDTVTYDLAEAELVAKKNSLTVSFGEKILWGIATTGIGILVWFLEKSV